MHDLTCRLRKLLSAAVGIIGLYVIGGWVFGNEVMVRVAPGSSAMPLNAALMFLALAFGSWPSESNAALNKWQRACVAIGMCAAALILVENGLGFDAGIDWPDLHRQVNDGNSNPGRVAPNTCIGLLAAAIAFFSLLNRSAKFGEKTIVEGLSLLVFLLGAYGILGYVLNLEVLYHFASYNRMAMPSALCLTLTSVNLWLMAGEYRSRVKLDEKPDQRIVRTSMLVLTIVAASAGLLGFIILKDGFESALDQEFLRNTHNTASAIQSSIEQRVLVGSTIASRPGLQMHLKQLSKDPGDVEALKAAHAVANSVLASGVTGLQLFNADRVLVDTVGEMIGDRPAITLPFQHKGQSAQLLWAGEFVLRTEYAMSRDGAIVGHVLVVQRLPTFTALLRSAEKESDTSDILVCGRRADDAICLPSRFYTTGRRIPMFKDGKPYLAISRALLGESGIMTVKDLRGIEVLAGYSPLADFGLGMVLKRDSIDLYAPISRNFNLSFLLLFLLVGSGTLLLRRQVLPLAQQLVAERAALRSLGTQLQEAVEIGQLGVWNWDLKNNAVVWNDKMFETYGIPDRKDQGDLVFEYWKTRLHPDDLDVTMAKLERALDGTGTYDPVFRILRPDGETRIIQAAGTVQRDEGGKAVRMLGINRDVTEQFEHERLLGEAKLSAEAANQAKSNFLANMSHEIRTPMNAIFGMLQLMQQTGLDTRQSDYVEKTLGAAKALLGIINDILDFSKVEAGKMTLEHRPFEIGRLLRDVGVVLGASVGDKDVEVLFDVDPTLPDWVMGDALRLQQILINLGGNAIKFTRLGEVVLSVRTAAVNGGVTRILVSVRDTGIGIPAEKLDQIFEGFSQAEASTSRRFGGTGLGLAISQRLVQLMGGDLKVNSIEGQGSTFYFEIPLVAAKEPEGSVAISHQPHPMPGLHALIVDDNTSARRIVGSLLDGFGWTVEEAGSGEAALEALERNKLETRNFDLILIDWRMPGIDGWETSQRIRSMYPANKAPLIFMLTAHGREILAQRHTELETVLDGFLIKPITASVLFDAIADARGPRHTTPMAMPVAATMARRLAGLRLLVAEDNQTNQQVVMELLSSEGASITIAVNGKEAIAALLRRESCFDAVLMDVQMPELDGYAATRHIREILQLHSLPIIAMTANALLSDRSDALAAGMDDHVSKPFDLTALVDVICKHVHGPTQETLRGQPLAGPAVTAPQAELPTLDSAKAIARFGGLVEIYRKVLYGFVSGVSDTLEELRSSTANNQPDVAERIVHSLKGLAGTIGAERLASRLECLERESLQEMNAAISELSTLADQVVMQAMVVLVELDAHRSRPPGTERR